MRDLTASEITEHVLKFFTAQGHEVWRQNNIRVPGRKFIGKKGLSDIIGYTKDGKMIAVEVKTKNDVLSPDQRKFLVDLHMSNGYAYVAYDSGNCQVGIVDILNYEG